MKTHTFKQLAADQPWPRNYLVEILHSAVVVRSYRFARLLAKKWLDVYPGDLPVRQLLAQTLLYENMTKEAVAELDRLSMLDPENKDVQNLKLQAYSQTNHPDIQMVKEDNLAIGKVSSAKRRYSDWSVNLRLSRKAMEDADLFNAQRLAEKAIAGNPESVLAGVTHLKSLYNQVKKGVGGSMDVIQTLGEHYHQRWPECVPILLIYADSLMENGQPHKGVALLHKAVAFDVTAEVAQELWGEGFTYHNLWPDELSTAIQIAIPAPVTALMGWNQLPVGKGSKKSSRARSESKHDDKSRDDFQEFTDKRTKESLIRIQKKLDAIADKLDQPILTRQDGRFPIYVIVTTKTGLKKKYGAETTKMIDREIRNTVDAVRQRKNWGSAVLYVDDPPSTAAYDIKPAKYDDAWSIKHVIAEMDNALAKQGARIGAILIVGGPDVVPFHLLPNPTDDDDPDVPSDNPYGTIDENYFITDWPVGRLPDGAGSDPGHLLSSLRAISVEHQKMNQKTPWYQNWFGWFLNIFRFQKKLTFQSFGISTEAWRRASISIYKTIGDPKDLVTSPPTGLLHADDLSEIDFAYFNLHGVRNAPEWYGQKDPIAGSDGPDYPTAFHPKMLDETNGSRRKLTIPNVIFTEACFGAHVVDKYTDDALSLKFILKGSQVFVGSTAISYGAFASPLAAADLLAKRFWMLIQENFPAGEALRRAKIHLAQEMHDNQGYLDGEDQKTLISFVLYGDPLAQPVEIKRNGSLASKVVYRETQKEEIPIVCDHCKVYEASPDKLSPDLVAKVKSVVEQYLPGMSGAVIQEHSKNMNCHRIQHICPPSEGAKAIAHPITERKVVVLSKSFQEAENIHHHYARVTVDENGQIIKMTVSH